MGYQAYNAWFSLASQALIQALKLLFHRENGLGARINTFPCKPKHKHNVPCACVFRVKRCHTSKRKSTYAMFGQFQHSLQFTPPLRISTKYSRFDVVAASPAFKNHLGISFLKEISPKVFRSLSLLKPHSLSLSRVQEITELDDLKRQLSFWPIRNQRSFLSSKHFLL